MRRRQLYGAVRPIIHARDKDRTLVAVGNRIFFDAPDRNVRWNTFTDLLFGYIRTAVGSGWARAELRKPFAERHQVMQWYDHVCRLQRETAVVEPNGLYAVDADGVTTAYLHLAYDLFILDDHRLLQKEVLRRLRRRENFAGARYELLVAATIVRAGCSIAFEDERDTSRRHPEFVATHKATGFAFSVEAKARQRTVHVPKAGERLKAGVRDLLTDAATKETVQAVRHVRRGRSPAGRWKSARAVVRVRSRRPRATSSRNSGIVRSISSCSRITRTSTVSLVRRTRRGTSTFGSPTRRFDRRDFPRRSRMRSRSQSRSTDNIPKSAFQK